MSAISRAFFGPRNTQLGPLATHPISRGSCNRRSSGADGKRTEQPAGDGIAGTHAGGRNVLITSLDADALPTIISAIRARGYTFTTVSAFL